MMKDEAMTGIRAGRWWVPGTEGVSSGTLIPVPNGGHTLILRGEEVGVEHDEDGSRTVAADEVSEVIHEVIHGTTTLGQKLTLRGCRRTSFAQKDAEAVQAFSVMQVVAGHLD